MQVAGANGTAQFTQSEGDDALSQVTHPTEAH